MPAELGSGEVTLSIGYFYTYFSHIRRLPYLLRRSPWASARTPGTPAPAPTARRMARPPAPCPSGTLSPKGPRCPRTRRGPTAGRGTSYEAPCFDLSFVSSRASYHSALKRWTVGSGIDFALCSMGVRGKRGRGKYSRNQESPERRPL